MKTLKFKTSGDIPTDRPILSFCWLVFGIITHLCKRSKSIIVHPYSMHLFESQMHSQEGTPVFPGQAKFGQVRHLSIWSFQAKASVEGQPLAQDSNSDWIWMEVGLCRIKAICGRHSDLKGKVHGGSKQAPPAITGGTLEPKTINDSVSTIQLLKRGNTGNHNFYCEYSPLRHKEGYGVRFYTFKSQDWKLQQTAFASREVF